RFGAGRRAQFRAVAADRSKLQRRENQVNVVERASGDQRQRAAGQVVEARQRLAKLGRNPNFLRRRRQVENGAVDVEEERSFAQLENEERFRKLHIEIGYVQAHYPLTTDYLFFSPPAPADGLLIRRTYARRRCPIALRRLRRRPSKPRQLRSQSRRCRA